MPDAEPLLVVREVSKAFVTRRGVRDRVTGGPAQRLVAVDGVSFEMAAHQAVGIVGESGSGKSTLAKCLIKLVPPDSGTVTFGATDVTAAGGKQLARVRRAMQLVYQDPYSSLNPLMTVKQAVTEPAKVHGLISGDQRDAHANELLDLVGLSASVADRRPNELSGGQRQRVAIARAMSVRPELLIADEPTSALDVSVQAQILNLFTKLRDEQGVAIILISHQLPVVSHLTDTMLVMYLGRVVESGPTEDVFKNPGHPYTAALLATQPGRHRRGRRDQPALRGEIPSPMEIPSGCRFRTRCPIAQPICHEVDPAAVTVGDRHSAWCHFAGEPARKHNQREVAGAGDATRG